MTWAMAKLSEVATIERNSVTPDAITSGTTYVGLEHISSGGESLSPVQVKAGELSSNKFAFDADTILFGKLRPYLAKVVAPSISGVCSTDILPIRPGGDLDKKFLLHFLLTPKQVAYVANRATGANLPRLSPKELAAMEIPLPPLEEQRRIAGILDAADALRRRRREALALLDTLPGAIFAEMFGEVLYSEGRVVDAVPLSEVALIQSGITKGRRLKPGETTEETAYLAVANVQDKRLDLSNVKTIEATEKERERYALSAGDLLLTEGGDPDKLGRGTIWNDEIPGAIHQNHIFRVRVTDEEVQPIFLSHLLSSPYGRGYFLRMAKQTTGIASINKTQLSAFPTILPTESEQIEFVEILRFYQAQKEQSISHLAQVETLFASLQSRAFAGEL